LLRILKVIQSLPEEEREVFNLVRVQGMSHAEAAEVIGCATKTVQRRLNRGLVLLEEYLRDLRPPRESIKTESIGTESVEMPGSDAVNTESNDHSET
jgi:hypothetical protein